MSEKADWTQWNEERRIFAHRDTEGLTKDLKALKAHILKLQAVCPKDSAQWPVRLALDVIRGLQKDYDRFLRYFPELKEKAEPSPKPLKE